MRQRMWRSILALSVGAILAGAASANPPSGCNSCDSGAKTQTGCGLKVWNVFRIGEGCAMPSGCSGFAAERTFAFGSCKQFFNPGNDCKICNPVHGPRAPVGPCVYGSYLNR